MRTWFHRFGTGRRMQRLPIDQAGKPPPFHRLQDSWADRCKAFRWLAVPPTLGYRWTMIGETVSTPARFPISTWWKDW